MFRFGHDYLYGENFYCTINIAAISRAHECSENCVGTITP